MKKSFFFVSLSLFALVALSACSNSDEKKETGAPKKAAPAATAVQGAMPNYRFVNLDTISQRYNLAIDFNEQMIRLQNNLAEEEKRQRNAIQTKANALQNKMNSVQSQADVDALKPEYESIQNMQSQAEQKLSQMGMEMEKTLAANSVTLQDSLTNFLRDYAVERGYDAVLVNSAAPYYNPALDVTDEVVEGLNARYNKVKK